MIFFLIFFLLILLVLITGLIGVLGYKTPQKAASTDISIVTAARNERRCIKEFIDAVRNVRYNPAKFELILVDDNSDDGTYESALTVSESVGNFNIIKAGEKLLPGKRGALLKGIQASENPFIMVTDADCVPSPGWLETASVLFEQNYDFIFGPAPLIRRKNNFISSVSCMENLKNHILSFSLASLGLPYTAAARNMGFSKEAFLKIGGYENTQETTSGDDDLLLREAVINKLSVKAFYDSDALVFSNTASSLSEYLDQKTRHTQSSFHYQFKHKVILGVWHSLNLFMTFSPLLMFLNEQFIWLFILRMLTSFIIIGVIQDKFDYKFTLPEILWFDVVTELFLIINFFNALFRKVEWKPDNKHQPG